MLKKQTIPQNLNARLAKVTALEEALAEVRGNLTRARNELEEVREDLAGSIQDRNFWMRSAQTWQRKFEQAQLERNRAIEDMVAAAAGQEIRRPAPAGLIRPGRRGAVGEDAVLFQEGPPMPAPEINRNMWDAPARQAERPAQAHIGNGWDDPPMANPRPARHDEADMQQANARPARANAHPPGWDDLMARLGMQEAQLRGQVNEARRDQRVNIHNYPAQAERADQFQQFREAEVQAAVEAARVVGRQALFDMEQQVVRVAGAVGEQLADPFEQPIWLDDAEPQREDAQAGPPANAEQARWYRPQVLVPDPFAGPVEPEPYDPAPPEPDEDPGRADW